MKSAIKFILLTILLTGFNLNGSIFDQNFKIFGGFGAPYGFGGVNAGYLINSNLEISAGIGFLGFMDNTVIDSAGNTIIPYNIGAKLFTPEAFWKTNIVPYVSCFWGTVAVIQYQGYSAFPYYEILKGFSFGYGFYIEILKPDIWGDIGINYLITQEKLTGSIKDAFSSFNFFAGIGLLF
ncbi:MAG: hypothetical protein PHV30_02335 [Candidatus Margulisbacteria bacterium]|nr:hypothetical protein [Candidatus Margulisiibacteriota bacterium]